MRSARISLRHPIKTRGLSAFMLAVGLLLILADGAMACKTPVYRFAMYNWDRTPYVIYYLHRGEIAAADAKVNADIQKLAEVSAAANLVLLTIDVAAVEPLKNIPASLQGEARRVFKDHKETKAPQYVVYSPLSSEVYAGAIKAADIPLFADSPARKQMTAMLAEGKTAVIILLLSDDTQANAKAEQEIQKMIAAARKGLITADPTATPGLGELDPPIISDTESNAEDKIGDATREAVAREDDGRIDVGLVKVSRNDSKERWLLRCLLQVEDELTERIDPMAFTVYGRGRANLPNIGQGIEEELLIGQIRFVMGPCSCQVKRGNPGMDLLTSVDWKSVAAAMAERHGTETGNEHILGEAEFPNIFLNGDEPDSSQVDADEPAAAPPVAPPVARSTDLVPDSSTEANLDEGSALKNLGYGAAAVVLLMAFAALFVFMRPRG